MSLRSKSPTFFTACTNNSENTRDDISTPPKELSPEDYKNLSAAVNLFFKNSKPLSLCSDSEDTRLTQPKRPYLLPLPPAQQVTQNRFGKQSDAPNFVSFSSVASFEAEDRPYQEEHDISSIRDDTVNFSARDAPYESQRNGRNHKRKLSLPLPSTSFQVQPYTPLPPPPPPQLQSPLETISVHPHPEMLNYLMASPQQQRYHNHVHQDFISFDTPTSSSYPRTPHLKRKSDPPLHINKKLKTLSPVPFERSDNLFVPMSETLWLVYDKNRQTREEQSLKFRLRDELHEILQQTFPGCALFIVGSTMNGMGTKNCDMDLCLMLSQREIDQGEEAVEILKQVSKVLSKCKFLRDRMLIRAKVPILKFRDFTRGIDVDLNINNDVGIRNTQLLNSYTRIDQRVSPLVIIIKLWARMYDINDAKVNTLSSYSLALMIIHYLQYVCKPPVVPCLQRLQPGKYRPDADVRKMCIEEELPVFVSQNRQTLGELFHGFLNYYANVFDFSKKVISIRTGGLIPRDCAINVSSPKNKKAHWKCISIEEPFDLTNTARSVFNDNIFAYITSVFCRCWRILHQTMEIEKIIEIPKLLESRR